MVTSRGLVVAAAVVVPFARASTIVTYATTNGDNNDCSALPGTSSITSPDAATAYSYMSVA
jgi:hypothetical protein